MIEKDADPQKVFEELVSISMLVHHKNLGPGRFVEKYTSSDARVILSHLTAADCNNPRLLPIFAYSNFKKRQPWDSAPTKVYSFKV